MAAANSSRLINTLQALALSDGNAPLRHFAEKLGNLLDLPDAFIVADNLRGLKRMPFKAQAKPCNSEALQQRFLQQKNEIEQQLIEKIKNHTRFDPENSDSYSRFYALCQSEMELSVVKMRKQLLSELGQDSARMARLVFLDTLLHDKLGAQLRSNYGVLPKLIDKHFLALKHPEQHQQLDMIAMDQENNQHWAQQLQYDLQSLLLAELELRLHPLMGLIEAVEENIGNVE